MIVWLSKYSSYVDVKTIKGDFRYIIECEDDYFLTEFKNILHELNINFNISQKCVMISHHLYNFNKIGGINIFIDQCKNIINNKYQIDRIKKELTKLNQL